MIFGAILSGCLAESMVCQHLAQTSFLYSFGLGDRVTRGPSQPSFPDLL